MVELLLILECILLSVILVVLIQKKEPKMIEPIIEMTEKVKDRFKAYGKKGKLKPKVNDDLQAFKIENDI